MVQFGEVTTEQAKARCTSALNALDAVVLQTKYLYQSTPDEEIQSIVIILVGGFLNVSQFGALLGVLNTEEYREAARFVDTEVRDRIDIPELEEEFKKCLESSVQWAFGINKNETNRIAIPKGKGF